MKQNIIAEFTDEIKADIANGNLIDGNYCIIVTTFKGIGFTQTSTRIRHVYKNLDEFENKAQKHFDEIDPMFGVDLLAYIFD